VISLRVFTPAELLFLILAGIVIGALV